MATVVGEAASVIALVQITEEIVKICGRYLSDVHHAQRDIERILEKTSDLKDVLVRLRQTRSTSVDMVRVQQCYNDTAALQKKISPSTGRTTMQRIGLRALKWPLQKGAVASDVRMLEDYLQFFSLAIQLDIQDKVDNAERDRLLDKLAFVGDAVFNSNENGRHRQCLENTRVDVLNEINLWASGTSSQSIFWLRGMAGTGKSTIALTIAHRYSNMPSFVMASYFFKKGAGDLAYSRKLLPTLVHQMARQSRSFCDLLLPVIQADPIIGSSAQMKDQFDKLLVEPLRQLEYSTASKDVFIWVLDALDICDDKSEIRLLLRLIAQTHDIHKLRLRVLITSRPETSVRDGFRNIANILHHDLVLHDVSRTIVDKDITVFFNHELADIRDRRRLPDDWPSQSDVQSLVAKSAGLFLFASTACLYVDGARRADPQKRLQQVCSIATDDQIMTRRLDQMYTIALQDSMEAEDYNQSELEDIIILFKRLVGSIILLSDPLSITELHKLLCHPPVGSLELVREALESLRAVIDVPDAESRLIRILHLSFRDFLLSRERCVDSRFWLSHDEVHSQLFLDCIELMSRSLRRKIWTFGPGTLRHEIPTKLVHQMVSPALQYACQYWIDHVRHTPEHLRDHGPLHMFLTAYALDWLMVMSMIGKTTEAVQTITELTNMLESQQSSSLAFKFSEDLRRFVLNFRHLITIAPYQVYVSALTFCPTESYTHDAFGAQKPRWVVIEPRVANVWGACRSTLEEHTALVSGLAFSSDGEILASGSYDGTVRLWNTKTGERRAIITGHSGSVTAVAFSNAQGNSIIGSGSDDHTARVWDAATGESCSVLTGHSAGITMLAFSPEGGLLVSASLDETLRVWDPQNGKCSNELKSPYGRARTMSFSPKGRLLASGTSGAVIDLWDIITDDPVRHLQGHSSDVRMVKFSPDGNLIASSSDDQTIRLWDLQSGQCGHILEGHFSEVKPIAFSPDGRNLASGSGDTTIRLWDVRNGKCLNVLSGHNAEISALLYSSDPKLYILASASMDTTIRLWDIRTATCHSVLEGHSSWIEALAFSPECQTLASGSWDHTVRLWNTHTTSRHREPLSGHFDSVYTIALSPDGTIAASGSADGTVRIWTLRDVSCRHVLDGDSSSVLAVAFSPNGQLLASTYLLGAVGLWNTASGKIHQMLTGHTETTSGVAFSPDGKMLVTGSLDHTIRFWDPQTGKCDRMINCDPINVITFSPNGEILASISFDGSAQLWDVQTGLCQIVLQGGFHWKTSLVFSPDGQTVASRCKAGIVEVWDVQSGDVLATREGCSKHATLAFPTNGNSLVVDGVDLPFDRRCNLQTQPEGAQAQQGGPGTLHIGLDAKREWITISGKRLLWLPSEYRPYNDAQAISNDLIVLGTGSGKVIFMRFDLDDPELRAYVQG